MTTISIFAKVLMYVALFVSCGVQLYQTHAIKTQREIIDKNFKIILEQRRVIAEKDGMIMGLNLDLAEKNRIIERLKREEH